MKTLVDDAATAVDHAMPPHDEDFRGARSLVESFVESEIFARAQTEDTHAAAVAAIAATVASDREIGGATLRAAAPRGEHRLKAKVGNVWDFLSSGSQ